MWINYLKAEVLPLTINFKEKVLQANTVEACLGTPLNIDTIFVDIGFGPSDSQDTFSL